MPGTSDVNQLEPCPFCDSTDLEESSTDGWYTNEMNHNVGWICCKSCEAEGPVVKYDKDYQPVRDAWNNGVKTK